METVVSHQELELTDEQLQTISGAQGGDEPEFPETFGSRRRNRRNTNTNTNTNVNINDIDIRLNPSRRSGRPTFFDGDDDF